MKVVFLDQDTFTIEKLSMDAFASLGMSIHRYGTTSPADVNGRIAGADIILTNKVKITRQHLEHNKQVKLIVVLATGYNNIDISAAKELGIKVCNVRSYGTPSVVQHVFMLIFNLLGKFVEYQELIRSNAWQNSTQFCLLNYPITQARGKTLGIIGYGELGRAVQKAAEVFGINTLIAERKGEESIRAGRTEFNALLNQADIISLHCPLNEHTQSLISTTELEKMKNSAILINVARGGVVDENALKKALIDKTIAAAGVDVLTQEPPSHGNLLLDPSIPNLIITPHNAWASIEAQQTLLDLAAENIHGFLTGEPKNIIV